MKVAHLSVSDHAGGAARAAGQIHRLGPMAGVDSRIFVSDSPTLPGAVSFASPADRVLRALNIDGKFGFMAPRDSAFRSVALVPTGAERAIRIWNPDIIHLHWVGRRTASIAQLGRLMRDYPFVWSFHDMWPFTGAEHYTEEKGTARWRKHTAYSKIFPLLVDVDRWVFERKIRHWSKPGHITVPNAWLEGLVQDSALMGDWTVHKVPWPVDTEVFYPEEKVVARKILGIHSDDRIILFGSEGGSRDPRKGADLFKAALEQHSKIIGPSTVLSFGGRFDFVGTPEIKVKHLGPVTDNQILRNVYSASDVLVLPSRQDNHSLVGIEAQLCGLPVVGFSNSGVKHQIQNGINGYLATDGDSESLARALSKLLADMQNPSDNSSEIADKTAMLNSPEAVGATLRRVYRSVGSI